MEQGELIVARLRGGVGIARYLGANPEGSRLRIATGRNRETQVATNRVMMATGVVVSGEEEVEEFRRRCDSLASDIDLAEVWELVSYEVTAMSLDDIADLYWGPAKDAARLVALLLHLHREAPYFDATEDGFAPRPQATVRETLDRCRRNAGNVEEAEALMDHLSRGELPSEITRHQSGLLDHLRGYAIHGENYTRAAASRALLETVENGTRDYQRLGFNLLVRAGVLAQDEPIELERAGISDRFPKDVLAEAASIDQSVALDEPGRRDLTDLPTFTVDDAGTEDRDDALSLEVEEPSSDHPRAVYRIGIHIADAGALIPSGGAVDQEASRRIATLYVPDGKVYMLPPEVSNRTGSLVPGERRAVLSLMARVTESGEILDWEVQPSMIRSDVALTYEEADLAVENVDHIWHSALDSMHEVALSLRQGRESAGAINLERPEMLIRAEPSGEVDVRVVTRSTPARLMVTELMIMCNSLLAEFCRREKIPAPYRSQASTDVTDVMTETPEGPLRWYLVVRRLPPADLDTVPGAHAGLGVPAYIQSSSPLRRYHDLVVQRQIGRYLRAGEPLYSTEAISEVAQRAEVQLREIRRLEEERNKYWFLKHLKQRIQREESPGDLALFQAIVLDNPPRRTALVELAEYPFRTRAELPDSYAAGDTVTLRLHGVDLWQRSGQFVHVP